MYKMKNPRLKYATSFKDFPSQTKKEFEKGTRINEAFKKLSLSTSFDAEDYVANIMKSAFGVQPTNSTEHMLDIRAKANRLYEKAKIENPDGMRGVSYAHFLDKYVENGKKVIEAANQAADNSAAPGRDELSSTAKEPVKTGEGV